MLVVCRQALFSVSLRSVPKSTPANLLPLHTFHLSFTYHPLLPSSSLLSSSPPPPPPYLNNVLGPRLPIGQLFAGQAPFARLVGSQAQQDVRPWSRHARHQRTYLGLQYSTLFHSSSTSNQFLLSAPSSTFLAASHLFKLQLCSSSRLSVSQPPALVREVTLLQPAARPLRCAGPANDDARAAA